VTSIALALLAAVGAYLLITSRRRPAADRPDRSGRLLATIDISDRLEVSLQRAGLDGVSPIQFAGAVLSVGALGLVVASVVLGFGLPSLVIAAAAAATPIGAWRQRRIAAHRAAQESWPRLIEELRVLTGSVGRPIPQALIEVGLRGPVEIRSAFVAAQREWALTTDFERMISVLKQRLDDPSADATFETLLIAHQVGGDIDRRLQALAEDRRVDVGDRKEAAAKQAGARFARWFVIIVPAGMAVAGLTVGDGRAAYGSGLAQVLIAAAVVLIVGCWVWAGRIMVVPDEQRVFDR
jgi:tight adherence protein B